MSWQVFYTPHTDDESIGMGGAIVRARKKGDNVMVVLVTDNRPSSYMTRVFGYEDRVDELAAHRRTEWARAMSVLDVTELRYWDVNEQTITRNPFEVQGIIERSMVNLHNELQIVHHHTVWGMFDIHVESGIGSMSHGLCANALCRLSMRLLARASLYGVYIYSLPKRERRAPRIISLSTFEMDQKRRALDCYKADDQSIGFGYRSVPELIDAAMNDPREFVMEIHR